VRTQHDLALLRLVAQRIAGPGDASAAEAVRWHVAVQAQDLPGALTSVALRTAERRRKDVEAALDDGSVVRSWPMRGTLHLVAAEDLSWLLRLLAPRVLAGRTARWRQLGLTDEHAQRAGELVTAALAGGRRSSRREVVAAMAGGGLDVDGQRGYHLLGFLAQTGTVCLGPMDGREQLVVLLGEWVRAPRRLAGEEALAELALRYFCSHGPATVKDLVRWAGSTVRDVRAGVAAVRDRLVAETVDGLEYFLDPATPDLLADHRREARGTFLLPGFDEFVLGYGDRTAVLDPEFAGHVVPGGNGMFRPTVVHDGRIVGTWQWSGRGTERTLTATPFTTFPDGVEAAVRELAAALGQL
jgi:hypothetical protein